MKIFKNRSHNVNLLQLDLGNLRKADVIVAVVQEAQQEIKSTVTVNTTDMTSRSESKDGAKETEKGRPPPLCTQSVSTCSGSIAIFVVYND